MSFLITNYHVSKTSNLNTAYVLPKINFIGQIYIMNEVIRLMKFVGGIGSIFYYIKDLSVENSLNFNDLNQTNFF